MKKTLIAALLAALIAPTLSGCVAAVATGATAGALAVMDRRTFGTQTEDEGIEWKILGNLMNKYGEKVHVNQTSYNRKVLLTGEVPDEKTKEDIERMVRGISGVQDVWNELQIGPPSTFQNRSNDAYITSKVKGRFVDGGKFRANLVKVVTEAGTVHLLGMVTRPEADSAIEIARTTAGVKKVVNVMEIITPEKAKSLDVPPPDSGSTQQPAPVQ
ncbi:MAG: BON domain-containing protein [Rhodocyclaceae bacterium]|nr:BON domain-containing protein [Azospira sp.]HNN08465.1 BON domain-containing protein [Azospira sp.]HNN44912.1 BON domain-containing protein [Azospira sp.]